MDPNFIQWPEVRITSSYNEEEAEDLRRSLTKGQEDAISVVQLEDGSYGGAAGYNRCLAAMENGNQILCVIRQGTHRDVVKGNLATAVQQNRPNPLNEVLGVAHAHQEEGFGLDELVDILGKTPEWVLDRIMISYASPVVLQCLGEQRIAIGHASLLAGLEEHADQDEALQMVLLHAWTVKDLEQHLKGGPPQSAPVRQGSRAAQGPQVCVRCSVEHAPSDVLKVTVCKECAAMPVLGADQAAVPVELLKEIEDLLAGSQAGAPLAERLAAVREG